MSSEALERIRELAESGRLHTWDFRRASDGHMSAVEADVSPDVLALLAEVARLEQVLDDEKVEWRAITAEAALAVAREREQRLREALHEIANALPATSAPWSQERARAALVDEPAAASARAHIDHCVFHPDHEGPCEDDGEWVAAADEPGETK